MKSAAIAKAVALFRCAEARQVACGLVIALALSAPNYIFAQSKIPLHIELKIADDDSVGRSLGLELKEAVRDSNGFRLVQNGNDWPYIKINLVTLRTAAGGTAAGYTISYDNVGMPMNGALIFPGVQVCTQSAVVTCARNLLAIVDGAATSLQQWGPDLRKTLK